MRPSQKAILIAALLVGITLVTFIAGYRWDSSQNRGCEFGYFGVFNRVRHALTQLPGVTIERDWANREVTLEEFGIDITTSKGEAISLDFQEADPIRRLSGEPLTHALANRIQAKRASP